MCCFAGDMFASHDPPSGSGSGGDATIVKGNNITIYSVCINSG